MFFSMGVIVTGSAGELLLVVLVGIGPRTVRPVILVPPVLGDDEAVPADEPGLPALAGADDEGDVVPVVDVRVVIGQTESAVAGVGEQPVASVEPVERRPADTELAAVAVVEPVLERLGVTLAADLRPLRIGLVAVQALGRSRRTEPARQQQT